MQATTTTKQTSLAGKVWCSVFGHHYETSRNITNHFKEYKCSVCELEITNDENGHIISLTPKNKNINDTLINFYKKRHHLDTKFFVTITYFKESRYYTILFYIFIK